MKTLAACGHPQQWPAGWRAWHAGAACRLRSRPAEQLQICQPARARWAGTVQPGRQQKGPSAASGGRAVALLLSHTAHPSRDSLRLPVGRCTALHHQRRSFPAAHACANTLRSTWYCASRPMAITAPGFTRVRRPFSSAWPSRCTAQELSTSCSGGGGWVAGTRAVLAHDCVHAQTSAIQVHGAGAVHVLQRGGGARAHVRCWCMRCVPPVGARRRSCPRPAAA